MPFPWYIPPKPPILQCRTERGLPVFSLKSWKRLVPLLLFFLGYSLLFFLWVKTFLYTLPFLAGFLIALAVQPVIGFL